jgi:4-azaleucine resistance transporter AzlC
MSTAGDTTSHPPATRSEEHPATHGSRSERFRRGLGLGLPIFLAYAPVGAAFGVLARTLGFSVFQAVLCSATAFSGAGQFIALSLLSGGATALMTVLATSVVNSRYVLFGTTLSPHLRGIRPSVMSWLAFTLTDETFAVNIADHREGLSTPASMAGAGAIALSGWVLGTGLGAAGAAWIGDPTRWGLDFAMPAMFAALFVALAENRRHVYVGILAGAVAILLPVLSRVGLTISPSWFVLIASVVSATVATVVFDER